MLGRTGSVGGSVGDGELGGDSVVILDKDVVNAVVELCRDSVVILDKDVGEGYDEESDDDGLVKA